ncbi:hypothetical protein APY04_2215 [Hyphomicrobium sulfonivorans]|uniref:Uncharacterized protein n=1 Tax=Hyphomicrobium sulfonivorans TaxID=121290 RepID=A0A120CUU5_HYPSL|nr:hypothetical protein APY04_2215 [Hyphomicrobium sulfonivorans]
MVAPPLSDWSCSTDGVLQATLANGEFVGVIGPRTTAPAVLMGIVALEGPPVAALLMLQ